MLAVAMIPRIASVCFRNRETIGILIPLKKPHHVRMIDLPQAAFRRVLPTILKHPWKFGETTGYSESDVLLWKFLI